MDAVSYREPGGVLTSVDMSTSVYRLAKCLRDIERTRVVSFRLPKPLVEAYQDLSANGKALAKATVASIIYALAKSEGLEVECEEQIKAMVGEMNIAKPQGTLVININVASSTPQVNVNFDLKGLDKIERLLEDLVRILEDKVPPATFRVLRKRVAEAERVLDEIRRGVN